MNTISLPPDLEAAITSSLRALPSSRWQAAARRLSERYRAPRAGTRPLATGPDDALGYCALVLPAAYAQLWGAMRASALRAPSFAPASMLDLGSGPGTALWAALDHWPSLTALYALEREPAFLSLAARLASSYPHPALRSAQWHTAKLSGPLPASTPKCDLVVLGHLINELDPTALTALLLSAWEHTLGLLLVVEPGTSAAFPLVLAARDLLVREGGAHVLAPCAHSLACPLPQAAPRDWCHFPQRLQRPQFQRLAKGGTAGWEEAKFSYVALSRFPLASPVWGRLLHQPQETKTGVDLMVSAANASLQRPHIPRRDARYRALTRLDWGDTLPHPLE